MKAGHDKAEHDKRWLAHYEYHLQQCNLLDQKDKLKNLAEELLRWNQTHNLTGYDNLWAVTNGLILDALMLVPLCRGSSCLDIGSGAGFPGLILALAHPRMEVTLLEGRRKRVSFQQYISRHLGINNVRSCHGRAGAKDDPLVGAKFTTVTCKALAALPLALNLSLPYLAPGGIILLPRARADEAALPQLREKFKNINFSSHPYELPGLAGPRTIVGAEFCFT
jgi:16S rRNA (guanine527-N7)-methyltransferase